MAVKQITVIKYSRVTDANGDSVTCEAFIQDDTDIKRKLFVKGCVDFELYNTGEESVFLWRTVEILPGESFSPRKSTPLPYASDIPMYWATDYELTRTA